MKIIKILPLIFLLTSCYGWDYKERGEEYIPYDYNEETSDDNVEVNDLDGTEKPDIVDSDTKNKYDNEVQDDYMDDEVADDNVTDEDGTDDADDSMSGIIRDKKIISIDASIYRTCAVDDYGSIYCWGLNSGINDPDEYPGNSFVPIKQIRHDGDHWEGVEKMSMGRYHACALLDDGFIYCWGENSKGQLGNESITDSYSSTLVYKSGDLRGAEIVDISVGSNHSCALDVDGSVYCWGFNMFGQIGDGTLENRLTPKKIFDGELEEEKVVKLSSGSNHVCVITDKDVIYCWGQNEKGQLGNGTYENATVPTKIDDSGVLAGKKIVDISSLSGHVCALDDLGYIYCWGDNDSGQLGDGTQENSPVPIAVINENSLKFKLFTAGWGNTCAVDENNDLFCWGKDMSLIPIKIDKGEASDTQIIQIDAGQSYACFINNSGAVYCWGENSKGELGDGTGTYKDSPVRVY